jgi:hypothetical protein
LRISGWLTGVVTIALPAALRRRVIARRHRLTGGR